MYKDIRERRAYQREWARTHAEQRRAYQQIHKNTPHFKAWAKAYQAAYQPGYLRRTKTEVFQHYSNGTMECACCKENTFEFLSLDHIEGGGTQDRKTKPTGISYWKWYIRNNFPSGYQVFCHNS